MLYRKSAAAAERRVVTVNDRSYVLYGFVGTAPSRGYYLEGNEANDNGLPQGFLVEQPPSAVTNPHFHETDQFQVIVGGGGHFGKESIQPLSIQYANAHTPYGPIVAGDDGITYFTLRAKWDPGAKYMPASRENLIKGNQRSKLIAGIKFDNERSRCTGVAPIEELIIPEEADHLAVWRLCIGPGQIMTSADPTGSGGQYMIVLAGTMDCRGEELPRHSVLFVTEDEPALRVHSGNDGLDLLVLQVPTPNRWTSTC